MVEPEVAFLEFEGLCELAEDFIVLRSSGARSSAAGEELKRLERDTSKLESVAKPFPRITYREAIEHARRTKGFPVKFGDDLGADEETALATGFDRPLIVSRFPTAIKSFYMQPDPQDPEVVLGLDMLAPEGYGEIIGGSQRIHDLDAARAAARGAQAAARGLRVVPRRAEVRHLPALRLRHGPRALRRLDLRRPPPARGDSRIRARSSGSTLSPRAMTAKTLPTVGVVSLGCPKNLVDTEVMLGHLQRAGHAIVPGRARRASCSSTRAASSTGPRRSRSRRSSSRSSARSAARSTGSSSRAAWSRSTAASSPPRSPRSTASSGSTSSRTRRPRRAGLPTLPRFTDKPLATRLYDERAPRVLSRRRGLRVPEGRRGLRQPVHVLHDPADARPAAQPHDRVARRRGAGARGAGRLGARPDLAGHDALRRGPRHGARRARAARRGAARRDVVSRGSASSTPTRRRSTTRSSSSWRGSRASSPTSTSRSSTSRGRSSPRCAAAATRRPTCAMIERMRETVPDDRDPHDVHRRVSRARARPSSAELCEFVRGAEFDNLGAFTYSPEPGSGSEPLGDPVPAEEKERRKDFLLSLQQPIARGRARAPPGPRRSRRSSRGRARRPSTCSRGACARRRPRSTDGS